MDDAVAFTRLRRMVGPYRVVTVEGTRHMWRSARPAARQLCILAVSDGEVVGIGRASLNTWTSVRGSGAVLVLVHPEHRGRGVGGQLYAQLEEHLRGSGARRVQGWAAEGEEAAGWCLRRGFERTHRARFSRLDLTDLDALRPVPPAPSGVSVASYAQVGPEAVYAVDAAAMRDEPGDVVTDAVSYPEWHDDVWGRPETDLDASTVVLVDGVPATATTVHVDRESAGMWSGGTGTVPQYRGRGLAKLAKSVALRRAAGTGIAVAYTANDGENRPMLAVNEWLGYRPFATQWSYVKTL